ncbi:MAG: hypothetical protein J7J78_01325 [Thermoprotei archaeon]|nr:hypothetical protein [Thermoprotei archaeon]
MSYTLDQGLFALAAFGVIIIANNEYCIRHVKMFLAGKDFFEAALGVLIMSGFVCLAGVLINIIINSDIPFVQTLGVFFSLLVVIALPQCKVLCDVVSIFTRGKLSKWEPQICGLVCGYWVGSFAEFAFSLNPIFQAMVVSVTLLPVILIHISHILGEEPE